jgi:hypothetical protein
MPFSIRPFRRYPMQYSIAHNAGSLIILLMLATLSGCLGDSLGEVRATEPRQTGTFQKPYEPLAACAMERIETDFWRFGQPIVQSMREKYQAMIRVYVIYSRSTLFELTFQPTASGQGTFVEYRRGYDGHGSQDQAWGILKSCAQEDPTPFSQPTGTTGANH